MAEVQGRHNPTEMRLSCQSWENWDFPRSGLGFTCFHCRRHGFEPWLMNKDPACQDSEPGKKKKTRTLSYGMETHALQVLTPSDSALGSLDVAPSRSYQQTGTRQRAVPLKAAHTPPCPPGLRRESGIQCG